MFLFLQLYRILFWCLLLLLLLLLPSYRIFIKIRANFVSISVPIDNRIKRRNEAFRKFLFDSHRRSHEFTTISIIFQTTHTKHPHTHTLTVNNVHVYIFMIYKHDKIIYKQIKNFLSPSKFYWVTLSLYSACYAKNSWQLKIFMSRQIKNNNNEKRKNGLSIENFPIYSCKILKAIFTFVLLIITFDNSFQFEFYACCFGKLTVKGNLNDIQLSWWFTVLFFSSLFLFAFYNFIIWYSVENFYVNFDE